MKPRFRVPVVTFNHAKDGVGYLSVRVSTVPKRDDVEGCIELGEALVRSAGAQMHHLPITCPIMLTVECDNHEYDLDRILTGVMTALDGHRLSIKRIRLLADDNQVFEAVVRRVPRERLQIGRRGPTVVRPRGGSAPAPKKEIHA